MKWLGAVIAVVVLGVAGVGCGEDEAAQVRAVVDAFAADLASAPEQGCRYFIPEDRRTCRLAMLLTESDTLRSMFGAEITRVSVRSNTASAAMTNDAVVRLRRVDGDWLIDEIDWPGQSPELVDLPSARQLKSCLSESGATGVEIQQIGSRDFPAPFVLGFGPSGAPLGVILTDRPFLTESILSEREAEYRKRPVLGKRAIVATHRRGTSLDFQVAKACLDP